MSFQYRGMKAIHGPAESSCNNDRRNKRGEGLFNQQGLFRGKTRVYQHGFLDSTGRASPFLIGLSRRMKQSLPVCFLLAIGPSLGFAPGQPVFSRTGALRARASTSQRL